MELKKYQYSAGQTWFGALLCLGMICFITVMLYSVRSDYHNWLYFGLPSLAVCGMAVYFSKKFFLPLLKGQTALELDETKLKFFISGRVIYWKDIQSIDYGAISNGGYEIRFTMIENVKDISISTKYIAGNDQDIYDTIVEYFKKYRSVESTS